MSRRPRVNLKNTRIAIELDVARHWNRRAMAGVVRYANECGTWQLFTESLVGLGVLRRDDPRGFDGAIMPSYTLSPWGADVPTVYFGTPLDNPHGPTFSSDNRLIAELAVEHLVGTGFPNLACVGVAGTMYSRVRLKYFRAAAERRGRKCFEFNVPSRAEASYSAMVESLTQWLDTLPLPCAVLGVDDEVAALVITAGRENGLRLPEELAVLGVNNDDLWCSSVVPSLSSVAIAADELGWQAARHLDQLIQRKLPYDREIRRFTPTGLIVRRSTDVVGYENPVVSEAVLLIRSRAPRQAVTVEEIADDLHVSRQYLSLCFAKHVGRSVKEEIDRVRIGVIREALENGTSSPKQLAHQMGFSDLSQFSRFCHRLLGHPPRGVPKRPPPAVADA